MASLNGIQLKNIKFGNALRREFEWSKISARIDIDGKAVGHVAMDFLPKVMAVKNCDVDFNNYSKDVMNFNSIFLDFNENKIIEALNKDAENKDEFISRVEKYFYCEDDEDYEEIDGVDVADFFSHFFHFYFEEKNAYKTNKKKVNKEEYNITVNLGEEDDF